jgi:F-type H+-transporting ATPase subunit b
MELIDKLGIDWKLLIAQVINFGILLFVLHRFAYKPILKMLQKRSQTIEDGLANAKKIEDNLRDSELNKNELLNAARQQGQSIITQAGEQAERTRAERLQAASKEVEDIISRAKQEIVEAKHVMLKEVKQEVADLVIQATEKILQEKLDEKSQAALVENALTQINKAK